MKQHMLIFALALPFIAGCQNGGTYVPVSGTVTLDDQPLPNVMVTFQPTSPNGSDTGGVGSYAMTDESGRYELEAMTHTPTPGAVVATHQVRIATPPPKGNEDSDAATKTGKPRHRDRIPSRYNIESTLTYEVPAGGTTEANFKLTK